MIAEFKTENKATVNIPLGKPLKGTEEAVIFLQGLRLAQEDVNQFLTSAMKTSQITADPDNFSHAEDREFKRPKNE